MPGNLSEKQAGPKSPFGPRSPLKPRYTRRAFFHDYTKPCIYMFTLRKSATTPVLSVVTGNPHILTGDGAPKVTHTPAGDLLQSEIDKLESYHPAEIKLIKTVIMPDHVHMLLRVIKTLPRPVTNYVAAMMSATTSGTRKQGMIGPEQSCFEPGITDSIVTGRGQFDIQYRYICDNPRRLLMKRLCNDLFRRGLSIEIGDNLYDAFGNMFLLRRPLVAVHVRRAWDELRTTAYHEECCRLAVQGWVMISPFIHLAERAIMHEVISGGGSVIKLTDRGFGERWKPYGRAFDLCAEGRFFAIFGVVCLKPAASGCCGFKSSSKAKPAASGRLCCGLCRFLY